MDNRINRGHITQKNLLSPVYFYKQVRAVQLYKQRKRETLFKQYAHCIEYDFLI